MHAAELALVLAATADIYPHSEDVVMHVLEGHTHISVILHICLALCSFPKPSVPSLALAEASSFVHAPALLPSQQVVYIIQALPPCRQ